jgi:protein-tyrosine phosphatase
MKKIAVLFVCTGNICRSPTAEGVARAIAARRGAADRFQFDSAGIQGHHAGDAPDSRTAIAAARRGYDLRSLRARRVSEFDFVRFDHILAMDRSHLDLLTRACPQQYRHKLRLFLEFAECHDDHEVPDPYYGGPQGFETVLDLVEDAVEGLLNHLLQK